MIGLLVRTITIMLFNRINSEINCIRPNNIIKIILYENGWIKVEYIVQTGSFSISLVWTGIGCHCKLVGHPFGISAVFGGYIPASNELALIRVRLKFVDRT